MTTHIFGWLLAALFTAIGVLNLMLVHPVPGIFYLVLAVGYLPLVDDAIKRKTGLSVPFWAKLIFALLVLWGTLAVGDLAEILGL